MKVLFLTSPAPQRAGFSTSEKRPPLGLGYLIAVLKQEGHLVYFSDEYLKPSQILDSHFIERNGIDFVGIYSNTICYQETLKLLEKLEKKREKKLWSGKIMIGGPHTSVGHEDIPGYVDYIVIGEGERAVLQIIKGDVKNRIVRGENWKDLDSLPMPAWEEFIHRPYNWSHQWHPVYPLYMFNTSRGCPFNCSFCSVKSIGGRVYRFQSAERIIEDIRFMMKYYGARGIYFREDHFTLNKERVVNFCELLLKNDIRIDWFCETRVDLLDDFRYQKLMADAGCRAFYIGVESGSPRMLEFYKKGETIEQFIKAFDLAKRAGIKTYASFIVGFPEETREDIEKTDRFIKRIKPDFVGKNIYLGLPGSELYDYLRRKGLYEYEDENHILYPPGFIDNIKQYYGNKLYYHVYDQSKIKEPGVVMSDSSEFPELSVVMAVYNQERFLADAVASILKQTFGDFEFIIVDDASTDRSPEILKGFQDPRIKVLRNETTMGLSVSLNKALKVARGKLIARMDGDDISGKERFQKQVMFLREHSDYHLVGTWSKIIDTAEKEIGRMTPPISYKRIMQMVSHHNPFVHSSTMFRREAIIKVGLYDEAFDYSQDYELWSRFLLFYKGMNLKEYLHCWRRHDAGASAKKSDRQKLFAEAARGRYFDFFENQLNRPGKTALFFQRLSRKKEILKRGEIVPLLCSRIIVSRLPLKKKRDYIGWLCRTYTDSVFNWGKFFLGDESYPFTIRQQIQAWLAERLYKMGKVEEAKALMAEFLNKAGGASIHLEGKDIGTNALSLTYFYLGEILYQLGDRKYEDYFRESLRLLRTKKGRRDVDVYRIASLYKRLNDWDNAVKWFNKLLEKPRSDLLVGTYFHLGEICYKKQQLDPAKKMFEKCLDLNPRHERAGHWVTLLNKKNKGIY